MFFKNVFPLLFKSLREFLSKTEVYATPTQQFQFLRVN